jgi:hypothetical protein
VRAVGQPSAAREEKKRVGASNELRGEKIPGVHFGGSDEFSNKIEADT